MTGTSRVAAIRASKSSPRDLSDRELFYERFAADFDARMNRSELRTRLRLVFDEALGDVELAGLRLLDAGAGTGHFSAAACVRGARVTAVDVGPDLLAQVRAKCPAEVVVGDVLALQFEDESFDVIVCSEVLEHTPDPRRGAGELARVLAPGGTLVVTTPNRVWHLAVVLANRFGLRPYEGLENWPRWNELARWLEASGLDVVDRRGFNPLPPVVPALNRLMGGLDRFGRSPFGRAMVNMMVVAKMP